MDRKRMVIDPRWEKVNYGKFSRCWTTMLDEAESLSFVGFDMEWSTSYSPLEQKNTCSSKKSRRTSGPTATVQLSTRTITFVFRVCDMTHCINKVHSEDCEVIKMIWEKVINILSSTLVFKVGVGISGDRLKLEADYPTIKVHNCVDLAVAHAKINDIPNSLSLKALCEMYTGRILSKNILIIRSNWGGEYGALSPSQIEYAASDSEASFDVCEKILDSISSEHKGRVYFLASCLNMDKPKNTSKIKNDVTRRKDVSSDWCKGRIKPYYDNINVLNPNGDVVFTVDKTKAKWYVEKKKLAEVVEWRGSGEEKEMATIQLFFSPNTEKYEDAHIRRNLDYFKLPKENICVVCSAGDRLVRFAVVPLLYRKHFPSVYMSHNSYDLLLLCTSCFGKASAVYEKERAAVAEDFGIPLGHLTTSGVSELESKIKLFEASIDDTAIMKSMEDDLIAHHIHPHIRLSLMKEFCEVQIHRNKIIQIIRYANALYNHYKSVGIIQDSRDPSEKRKNTTQPTSLPPERYTELKKFVEEYGYTYPFCKGEHEISSPEGVCLLLQNGKVSHQEVLRLFWVEQHPEIVDEIPPRTRTEKDELESNHDLPVFEGHGFLVVRALLKKYSNQGNWRVGKRAEHAVGQFIFRWRNVFLKHMSPKYLPDGWVSEDGILQ